MKKIVCLMLVLVISLSCCAVVTSEITETTRKADSSADDGSVLSWLSKLWGKTENFTKEKWDNVLSHLKTLWEKVTSFFSNTSGSLSDIFGKAKGSVAELLAGITDYVYDLTGQISTLFA